MAIKVVTAPALEPVTLGEARLHCRVDVDDDDDLLLRLIMSAREYAEQREWRAYLTQTLELYLDCWPARNEIRLPRPPLQSVTSVKYYDEDDVEYTLASTTYMVDAVSQPGRLVLKADQSWPTATLRPANAVVVRFVAGWASLGDLPLRIKQAMLLLIGHWYENREATISGTVSRQLDFAVASLLGIDSAKRF
jgi:uncharacterized phiE125 gp8 family phage protein